MKKVTQSEMLTRRRAIVALMRAGLTKGQVVDQASQPREGRPAEMARGAATRMYDRILKEWRDGFEEQQGAARVEAVERVRRDLAELRNPGQLRDASGKLVFEPVRDRAGNVVKIGGKVQMRPVRAPVNMGAVAAHETLLAKLEGSFAPIEVKVDHDVTIRRSLLAVVQSLTPEKRERIIVESEQRDRELDEARARGVRMLNGRLT